MLVLLTLSKDLIGDTTKMEHLEGLHVIISVARRIRGVRFQPHFDFRRLLEGCFVVSFGGFCHVLCIQ